jgi:hypothetical protein
LRSTTALRDRLKQLLDRAATLDEVLNLEQQMAPRQTDIDALQSRLDHLGPAAQAGRGVVWALSKLFVIR